LKEAEEHAAREEEERKEAEERAAREAREAEECEKERLRLEEVRTQRAKQKKKCSRAESRTSYHLSTLIILIKICSCLG
jgi:hypothetical protein